jgi:Tfp pilus assembly pilus retraction ATPase PilT
MVQKLVPSTRGGKVAVRELMINDPNFSEVIKTGQMHMIRSQMEGTKGNFSLEDSLAGLYQQGLITTETAHAQASSIESLNEKLDRLR